ncbi:MAG: T9SS type A sorting domain-containing protein [Flavobacteriales bacterium]
MTKQSHIIAVLCFACSALSAQVDREGEPLSWNFTQQIPTEAIWNAQPFLDILTITAEDALVETDKATPFRFAKTNDVNYNLENSGRWTNLANGDRIWMLGIECADAYSVGITFSDLELPRGANVFIYSENHQEYIGPLTENDNRVDQLVCMPPVFDDKIILEYYEPYAFRGEGRIEISSVAQGYRNLRDESLVAQLNCMQPLQSSELQVTGLNASSSVLMMIVDNGQRIATGTMVNNSSNNAIPYVLTASSALVGESSSWLFLFDVAGSNCMQSGSVCLSKAVCGAYVVDENEEHGITLLRLRSYPRSTWSAYYSGFSIDKSKQSEDHHCLQNAFGLPQSIATFNGVCADDVWNGLAVSGIDGWQAGQTFKGAVGSPIFDEAFSLIGIYLGGGSSCSSNSSEYFASLHSVWEDFKQYLDPHDLVTDELAGFYPIIPSANQPTFDNAIFIFPNPANSWIYVQNKSENPLLRIEAFDASGKLVTTWSPIVPTIDTSSLIEGVYHLHFIFEDKSLVQKLLVY